MRRNVVHLQETSSTNEDAMRLALAGEALPLWVTADIQTSGRGRAGRVWTSEPGNLHASVAFRCDGSLAQAGQLALVAGIALYDAVAATSPLAGTLRMRLKWPNDLLIGGAKAGGILVETTAALGEPGYLGVIGFGLNVRRAPAELGRAATSLAASGIDGVPEAILDHLAGIFAGWLAVWDGGRAFSSDIAPEWTARSGQIGECVSVTTTAGVVSGRYLGIDALGYIRVERDDGSAATLTHGDVALAVAVGDET